MLFGNIITKNIFGAIAFYEPGDGSMAHAFITKNIRDTFPLGMSFAESLVSELPDDSGSLTNSIRGIATSRVESNEFK